MLSVSLLRASLQTEISPKSLLNHTNIGCKAKVFSRCWWTCHVTCRHRADAANHLICMASKNAKFTDDPLLASMVGET